MRKLVFTLISLCSLQTVSFSQQDNVYKIIASFDHLNETRQLTAFYLNTTTNGLITALHGVLGANEITASCGFKVYEDLYIIAIDIPHDIAVITCPSLQKELVGNGFIAGPTDSASLADKQVVMYGTSYDTEAPEDIVMRIMKRPIWLFTEVIESSYRSELLGRKSPALNAEVIRVQGDIAPGNSGAPVLLDNKVIGIASGGLRGGATGRCWIIPIHSMNCSNYEKAKKTDDYKELLKAHRLNPYLFNYQLAMGKMTIAEINFCNSFDTLFAMAQTNFEEALGEKYYWKEGIYTKYASLYEMPDAKSTTVYISADLSNIREGAFFITYDEEEISKKNSDEYRVLLNKFQLIQSSVDKCLLYQGFEKTALPLGKARHELFEDNDAIQDDQIIRYINKHRKLVVYVRLYTYRWKSDQGRHYKWLFHRSWHYGRKTIRYWTSVDIVVFNTLSNSRPH